MRRKGKMIRIFTLRDCPYCEDAKLLLAREKVMFGVVDVTRDPGKKRARIASETGCVTLPSVWVGSIYVGGLETGPPPYGGLRSVLLRGMIDEIRRHPLVNRQLPF